MNVDSTAGGGRLCSQRDCRRVPARMSRSWDRFGLEDGPTARAAAFQRVRIRSIATVHAVATVKIDRGRQYKNTKSCRNLEIQSQTRVVNGIAALVTTPLRSLVTSAPSDQAGHVPGIGLSHRLHSMGSDRSALPDKNTPDYSRLRNILNSNGCCPGQQRKVTPR